MWLRINTGDVSPLRHRFHWRGAGSRLCTGQASSPFCPSKISRRPSAIGSEFHFPKARWQNPDSVFEVEIRIAGAGRVVAKSVWAVGSGWPLGIGSIRYGPPVISVSPSWPGALPLGLQCAQRFWTFLQNPAATHRRGCSTRVSAQPTTSRARRALPALRGARNNVGDGFANAL